MQTGKLVKIAHIAGGYLPRMNTIAQIAVVNYALLPSFAPSMERWVGIIASFAAHDY